jgi:hypothetical protein
MRSFVSRRLRNAALGIAALAVVAGWTHWQESRLGRADFHTGYLLLATITFLALYNLRKKLPVSNLITSAGWLQTHIYVGLGSAFVLGLHIGWRVPNGILEGTLALLYLATFASGLVGLYWSRTLPRKLAGVSEEVIYERIPMLRGQLRERAQEVALAAVRASGATTLGEYYAQNLQSYFEKPRSAGYYLRPTSELRRELLAGLTAMGRYLSEHEQQHCEQLFALVRRRDDLDYHAALQWRLKAWLFLHIGLTYPLLLAACLHGWLAHLFDGGAL